MFLHFCAVYTWRKESNWLNACAAALCQIEMEPGASPRHTQLFCDNSSMILLNVEWKLLIVYDRPPPCTMQWLRTIYWRLNQVRFRVMPNSLMMTGER